MEINSMTYVYFIYKLSKIIPLFLFFFFGQDPNEVSDHVFLHTVSWNWPDERDS